MYIILDSASSDVRDAPVCGLLESRVLEFRRKPISSIRVSYWNWYWLDSYLRVINSADLLSSVLSV